jgi:hypothetical protein
MSPTFRRNIASSIGLEYEAKEEPSKEQAASRAKAYASTLMMEAVLLSKRCRRLPICMALQPRSTPQGHIGLTHGFKASDCFGFKMFCYIYGRHAETVDNLYFEFG